MIKFIIMILQQQRQHQRLQANVHHSLHSFYCIDWMDGWMDEDNDECMKI